MAIGLDPESIDQRDPIAGLDVELLQKRVLEPIFAIGDPRTDKRIDFVGGGRGTAELSTRQRRQGRHRILTASDHDPAAFRRLGCGARACRRNRPGLSRNCAAGCSCTRWSRHSSGVLGLIQTARLGDTLIAMVTSSPATRSTGSAAASAAAKPGLSILIADKFEPVGVDGSANLGCDVQTNPDLTADSTSLALTAVDPDILDRSQTKITEAAIDAAERLSLIIRAGAGYDNIDVKAASGKGIFVANCPGKNSIAVAELAWALLACDRRVPDHTAELRSGTWNKKEYAKAADFSAARSASSGWARSDRKSPIVEGPSGCASRRGRAASRRSSRTGWGLIIAPTSSTSRRCRM